MTTNELYIGRMLDQKSGKTLTEKVTIEPADLTTHAFVTGMTGSGKTGLCIALLEEAALQHIPALVVDPKGDLTNLLLHFPNLAPNDFEPWMDPDLARREGKSVQEAAAEFSSQWRKGLADWGISGERVEALRESVDFTI